MERNPHTQTNTEAKLPTGVTMLDLHSDEYAEAFEVVLQDVSLAAFPVFPTIYLINRAEAIHGQLARIKRMKTMKLKDEKKGKAAKEAYYYEHDGVDELHLITAPAVLLEKVAERYKLPMTVVDNACVNKQDATILGLGNEAFIEIMKESALHHSLRLLNGVMVMGGYRVCPNPQMKELGLTYAPYTKDKAVLESECSYASVLAQREGT